jgi:hypothetical protein
MSPAAVVEPEVIESQVPAGLALVGDAEVDIQVATARRFPRSIAKFLQTAQEMATLTPEIAAACIYALPRDGKTIEGPSARFAEVMASAWGNLRAEGKTLGDDGQYVTSRGTAWDVQNNVAIAFEVKRRITNRNGQTYNADMISVTGNAGSSIGLRNAILKVIPTPFWKPIYNACRKVIAGDAKTFASRRDDMLKAFAVMGVTEERLCGVFGLKGKADITLEHMVTLTGFYTALKDGDTTIEEAFPEGGGLSAPQPAQRKSQQAPATTGPEPARHGAAQPEASQSPAGVAPSQSGDSGRSIVNVPEYIGVIVAVNEKPTGTLIKLDTGFQCATRAEDMIRAAKTLADAKARVELMTRAPRDPKNVRILEEITPLGANG